jgi:hypothetical protein
MKMSRASIREMTPFILYGGHPNQNPNWIALALSTTNFPTFFLLAGQPLAQPTGLELLQLQPSPNHPFVRRSIKSI